MFSIFAHRIAAEKAVWALAVAACLTAIGCGPDDPYERVIISGKVAYNGVPVENGEILFKPMAGTEAPTCAAVIRDGAFRTTQRGGVPPGSYRVYIRGFEPSPASAAVEDDPRAAMYGKQFLPDKYNKTSELTIDVPAGEGEIVHDFDLQG